MHLLLLFGLGVVLVTAAPQREEVGPDSKKFVPPGNRVIIGYRTVTQVWLLYKAAGFISLHCLELAVKY